MHASGFFTAGLIVGMSFGVLVALGFAAWQQIVFTVRYRDKSEEAESLRQVARTAKAVHRAHHEKRLTA